MGTITFVKTLLLKKIHESNTDTVLTNEDLELFNAYIENDMEMETAFCYLGWRNVYSKIVGYK